MLSIPDSASQGTPSSGIVYISTGHYLKEACVSVTSLRQSMMDIHVTLFSEIKPPLDLFNTWIKIEDPTHSGRDKVIHLKNTPYQNTLYLDSDTYIAKPLDEIFNMLDVYDFLGVIGEERGYWYGDEIGIPKTFPEINGGVLAFRNSDPVMHILTQWETECDISFSWQKKYGERRRNQPSLRKLLWELRKDLKIGVLPTEYNLLSTWGSFVFGDPVIIHTRNNPARMVERVRRHTKNNRVWLGQIGCVRSPYYMTLREWFVTWLRIQAVFVRALFF